MRGRSWVAVVPLVLIVGCGSSTKPTLTDVQRLDAAIPCRASAALCSSNNADIAPLIRDECNRDAQDRSIFLAMLKDQSATSYASALADFKALCPSAKLTYP